MLGAQQVRQFVSDRTDFLDTRDMPLEKWLELVDVDPPNISFVNYCFPTDRMRDEYIDSLDTRSEAEVKRLLENFLMQSCSLVADEHRFEFLQDLERNDPKAYQEALKLQATTRLNRYHFKVSTSPPWEGNTWVLDLLPSFPHEAIEALSAYLLAHYLIIPDGKADGIEDALCIIRAKYIGTPHDLSDRIAMLTALNSRQFEHIVERLYSRLGYDTTITPASRDGGRDVIAASTAPGKLEQVRVECKRYSGRVGVAALRQLLGVVSDEKVNKGVLITTGSFSKDARRLAARNPRVELIDGSRLVVLLNEHLGERWPTNLDRLIAHSIRHSDDDDGRLTSR
jgi:restriction system protein